MRKKLKVIERKLGRERAWGQAFSGEFLIEVDPRQPPREYLDTLIHEALHIFEPDWTERKICITSRKISSLVWEMGYRRFLSRFSRRKKGARRSGPIKSRSRSNSRIAKPSAGFWC